jgi:hypothetical protein
LPKAAPTSRWPHLHPHFHPLQVTAVFCSIDGARKLRWKRADARQEVHSLCSRAIRACLRAMPEGYISGEQPGELKYMVAFARPEVGLGL